MLGHNRQVDVASCCVSRLIELISIRLISYFYYISLYNSYILQQNRTQSVYESIAMIRNKMKRIWYHLKITRVCDINGKNNNIKYHRSRQVKITQITTSVILIFSYFVVCYLDVIFCCVILGGDRILE